MYYGHRPNAAALVACLLGGGGAAAAAATAATASIGAYACAFLPQKVESRLLPSCHSAASNTSCTACRPTCSTRTPTGSTVRSAFSRSLLWSAPTSGDNTSGNSAREHRVAESDQSTSSIVAEDPTRSAAFSVLLAIICGITGPLLQSYRYAAGLGTLGPPTASVEVWQWWPIPELYGITGLLIGWLYIFMDNVILDTNVMERSVDCVLFGFGIFLSQYLLAGALYIYGFDEVTILASTMLLAGFGFAVLDGTGAGMVIATLIAGAGPMAEEMLLPAFQGLDEQMSVSADITAPVYFLGSIVCGNTARAIWMNAGSTEDAVKPIARREGNYTVDRPRCLVCRDTRAVECTTCNAIGSMSASDGSRRRCEVCNGRGLVFCKQCAFLYGDDPNDTARIEEIMRRIPD